MKKKYEPIQTPVCRCGRMPVIANRKNSNVPAWYPVYNIITDEFEYVRCHEWLCGCGYCQIIQGGSTKREAVEKFAKEVQIHVDT